MTLLLTGALGFVGSTLVRLLLAERPGWRIVNLDVVTYAGNPENLAEVEGDPRYRHVRGDVCDGALVERLLGEERVEAIVHLAAESHVDRSIAEPAPFVRTNVLGTPVILEAARRRGIRVVHVSTDEVYGPLGPSGRFTEASPLLPSSPYSASKAAGDLLALAYARTYGLPVSIVRACNTYGPRQFPEKLLPLAIANALRDLPVPVYGDGTQVRDWIHVEDHARGILAALERGAPGRVYNLGADCEKRNVDLLREVLALLGKPASLLVHVADRPGHDARYALDASRARAELGWSPRRALPEGLAETVRWYVEHRAWWERIVSGEYREWYARQYGGR
jgi:dTDP-glucose 4,6-dehydratase